jgi:hypothetical protein
VRLAGRSPLRGLATASRDEEQASLTARAWPKLRGLAQGFH